MHLAFFPLTAQAGQCLLTLTVNGNAIPATGIHGGPVLCQANGDGSPNRNQCYQPVSGATLNIQKTTTPPLASIAITNGLPLHLKTFGSSQTITLTNLSTNLIANNINAVFNGTPLEGIVTATTCTSLAPRATCTMTFTSGRTVAPPTAFTIQGSNTSPVNATLNIRESFLYVTNASLQPYTLYRCSIEDDAQVDNCIDAGGGNAFASPTGLVINKAGTLAYVANNTGNPPVMKCAISAEGLFTNCEDAGGGSVLPFNGPYGIALTADESKLYVANAQGGFVSVCPISANGSLGDCIEARDDQFSANSVILSPSSNYVYVTDPGAALSLPLCQHDSEGKLVNCVNGDPGFVLSGPHSMAINSIGSRV